MKRITDGDFKLGDLVEFKGKGPVYEIISRPLKLFERHWDRWGWHVAFICETGDRGIWICEAVAPEVRKRRLDSVDHELRFWRWLDDEPLQEHVNTFLNWQIGRKYDVTIYFWTMAQYLIRHFFNRRIPRLLDNRYTCWELVWWFYRMCGKPIQSIYDCPLITDLFKEQPKQKFISATIMEKKLRSGLVLD